MLLIKCPQCNRSYRLAESLYRRKAAGFGVVITCRHCKTQIHVDEGVVPTTRHTGDPLDLATETDETDASWVAEVEIPDAPPSSSASALPLVTRTVAEPVTPVIRELDAPTLPPVAELDAPTLPPSADHDVREHPPVVPRQAGAPRAVVATAIPRPGAAPRPGGSATGTPLPLRTTTSGTTLGLGRPIVSATATPTPSDALTPTPGSGPSGERPKIVALSPGLLGVKTGPRTASASPLATAAATPKPRLAGMSATATPRPSPPKPALTAAANASLGDESAPNSSVPLSIPDAELFAIDSQPPESTIPLDSVDYLESVRPVAPVLPKGYERNPAKADDPEATPIPHARDKRLPQPPARNAAQKPAAEATPRRRRLPSGDLSDDFLNADLGFDAAPALAPPDAAALLRAASIRPRAGSVAPGAQGSTKAPVSTTAGAPAEKKGGRSFLFVALLAACAAGGYFFVHRVPTANEPAPEANAAVTTPPVNEPAPAPVADTASATAATTAAAVASSTPSATAPVGPSTPVTATVAAVTKEKPARSHGESEASGSKPEPTADEQAATSPKSGAASAPASTAALEPHVSAGTDPFDVAAARTALEATAAQASSCRKAGDPSGVAIVTLTFSPSGRVTTAQISGPPFQATATGGCIASTLRRTRVPAFAGEMVTVRKTVTIE